MEVYTKSSAKQEMKKQYYIVMAILILSTILLYVKGEALYVSATVPPYDILNDINQYRSEKGLGSLQKSIVVCGLAAIRVQEIKTDFSHKQFHPEIDKIPVHGMFYENLAMVGINSKTNINDYTWVVPAWKLSKAGHNEAMLVKDMTMGCVVGSDGYYVFEGYIKSNSFLGDPIF
jgi:hypothetical protein